MNDPWAGTLRITKKPPRRPGFSILVGLLAVLVLAGSLICAGLIYGPKYLDQQARNKLEQLGSRAGLSVQFRAVELNWNRPLSLIGVEVRDESDNMLLFRARRINTDLTLRQLWDGQRRPRNIHMHTMSVDLSVPQRWKTAAARWRDSGSKETRSATKRTLPIVSWSQSNITLPMLPGVPIATLDDAAGQLIPGNQSEPRWNITLAATTNSLQKVDAAVLLDRVADEHELGISFDPALEVEKDDIKLQLSSAFLRNNKTLRLKNLKLERNHQWAHAEYIEITPTDGDLRPEGPVTITLAHARAGHGDASTNAAQVNISVGAGEVVDWANRLERFTARQIVAEHPEQLLAIAAVSAEVTTQGIDTQNVLKSIKKIRLTQADLSWVLPHPDGKASIPYYQQIESLFTDRKRVPTTGGGPVNPAPPTIKTPLPLLSRPPPSIEITDGSLELLSANSTEPVVMLDRLNVSVVPRNINQLISAELSGRLKQFSTGEEGQFSIDARAHPNGEFAGAHIKLSGGKWASQLARISDAIRLSDDAHLILDVDIEPHLENNGFTASGNVRMSDVGFHAPRIHGTEVNGLVLETTFSAALNLNKDQLVLDMPKIQINEKASLRLAATISRLDGRLPKLDVKLRMPKQSCQGALNAIPREMSTRIRAIRLSGETQGHIDFTVDLEKPRTFKWDIDVNMSQCKIEDQGIVDVEKLNTDFIHEVVEKGAPTGIEVGPGTHHYRALSKIPKYVQMAAIYTEDHSFFRHEGFRPPLIRRAIVMDLERGRYVYGGSTISQQLVKNLFLSREKTLSRKLEEAIIVWMMERTVTKQRILELYLNCIEYGPSLYGLSNAARAYFGKRVQQLLPLEAAFLMGLKPYPWNGWRQYKRGYVSSWWRTKRLPRIIEGMHKRGWITEEEFTAAQSYDPIFLTSPHASPNTAPDTDSD